MKARRPVMKSKSIVVAGVMTGTSCDGLDLSILDFSPSSGSKSWSILHNASYGYPEVLRRDVLKIQKSGTRVSIRELLELDRRVGLWLGDFINQGIKGYPVDAIAIHGQTIAHHPDARVQVPDSDSKQSGLKEVVSGLTLQIASPEAVAVATKKTVISHFRDGDLAAGGQGAPLVPFFHREWAKRHLSRSELRKGVAVHNIGGISNLSYLHPNGSILAFDTGLGNAWMDWAASRASRGKQTFDRNGDIAASTKPRLETVRSLMKHRFLKQTPPKSTGRDDFPISLFEDALKREAGRTEIDFRTAVSTATEFTAASIVDAYRKYIIESGAPLKKVLFCGGGALNLELLRRIREGLERYGVEVDSMDSSDRDEWNPQYIEAQAFALFGRMALSGLPYGGAWTGVKGFGPPARITPGENFSSLLRKLAGSTIGRAK